MSSYQGWSVNLTAIWGYFWYVFRPTHLIKWCTQFTVKGSSG